jgi:DNA-binding NarL/FixJ family response regulator
MRIRVAICDDDRQYLASLAEVLRKDAGLELVATVCSGQDALAITECVDVWLMDIRLPRMLGIEVATRLRSADPNARVVLMTSYPTSHVLDSLTGGASGFIHKDEPLWKMPTVVRCTHAGLRVGSEIVHATLVRHMERLIVLDPDKYERIVRDERDALLLQLIRRNATVKDMAAQIKMSVPGAKKRLAKLFERAGVRNQQQLVNWLYDATQGPVHLAEEPTAAVR